MNIAIAGTGYVGIVTAAVLSEVGHKVVCVDVDEAKLQKLRDGICPIYEEGLAEILQSANDRLTYTSDYATAYNNAEVIFIAVGTPEKSDGSANLKYVFTVAEQIADSITSDTVVVVKSTVPIGTNEEVDKIINKKLGRKNLNIWVVSNPEFLSQGTAVNDMRNASRIVIGTDNDKAKEVMIKVYESFHSPLVLTDRKSAEMIKYASNDFLALKLSYINEIANLCEIIGADIEAVARGMGLDPRISPYFLKAGIGYGGSCFPKDTKALHWLAGNYDYEFKTVKASIDVNEQQKIKLIKKAMTYIDTFEGKNVAVLGLSFKPGTDDLRESPALECVPMLLENGAKVKAWDSCAMENFRKLYPDVTYCNSIESTLKDTDMCFIFTDWADVKSIDPSKFGLMKYPLILDGRNCFDPKIMDNYDVIYDSIGRRKAGKLVIKS